MVGGGRGAFIGAVHRAACALDRRPCWSPARSPPTRERPRFGARPRPRRRPRATARGRSCSRRARRGPSGAHRLRRDRHAQPRALPRSRSASSRPASTSSATSRSCTPATQAEELVAHRQGERRSSSASPTTTRATRWCGTRATWSRTATSASCARSSSQYHQGWLATLRRIDRQQAGRVAHRPGALAASPARSATSARTRRTSPPRSPAGT